MFKDVSEGKLLDEQADFQTELWYIRRNLLELKENGCTFADRNTIKNRFLRWLRYCFH